MTRTTKPTALETALRRATKAAAAEAGSLGALATATKIPQPMLWRFLDGKTLSLNTAGQLAAALGYELTRKTTRS